MHLWEWIRSIWKCDLGNWWLILLGGGGGGISCSSFWKALVPVESFNWFNICDPEAFLRASSMFDFGVCTPAPPDKKNNRLNCLLRVRKSIGFGLCVSDVEFTTVIFFSDFRAPFRMSYVNFRRLIWKYLHRWLILLDGGAPCARFPEPVRWLLCRRAAAHFFAASNEATKRQKK